MSVPYPKIQSIFKRDEHTHQFLPEFSLPEFAYLQTNVWEFTEKIDGTNIRITWDSRIAGNPIFQGKTDNAEIPIFLHTKLNELFPVAKFTANFPDTPVTLYGEGYGSKIQKGGKYIPDGVSFMLFDVKIDKWWLERPNVADIAKKLGIPVVPVIGEGTLAEAVDLARKGFNSLVGECLAEGIVLRPKVALLRRNGERIISKVKHKDFKGEGTE